MSRYIDADALNIYNISPADGFMVMGVTEEDIDLAPSIDIVRCQDCKYWNYEMSGCKRNPSVVAWRDNDFCSYGEREGE